MQLWNYIHFSKRGRPRKIKDTVTQEESVLVDGSYEVRKQGQVGQ